LSREDDDDYEVFNEPVFAQFYPKRRFEEWWLVVG
jgi:hypothetical protein